MQLLRRLATARTGYAIASVVLTVAGCASGNAASTNASIAPPTPATATTSTGLTTTIVTTTVAAPATTTAAPRTTAAPTTTAPTPERQIADRHLAFAAVLDQCAKDPPACDPATTFIEYVSPDSEQYEFYSTGRDGLVEKGKRVIHTERIERRIVRAEIGDDGTTGHTVNCIVNGSVYLEATNETRPNTVAYGREDYFWELVDGKWIAIGGILEGLPEEGDGECTF